MAIRDLSAALPQSEADAIQTAIAGNAALKELVWRQEAAKREIRVAGGAFLPDMNMSLTGEHNPDQNTGIGSGTNDDVAFRIDVHVPLFDGGARRAEVSAARSAYRESGYNVQAAQRDLVVIVQSIWARAAAAREVTRYAESRLSSAREAFTGVRDELEARKDILDAELSLDDAHYSETVARHQRSCCKPG